MTPEQIKGFLEAYEPILRISPDISEATQITAVAWYTQGTVPQPGTVYVVPSSNIPLTDGAGALFLLCAGVDAGQLQGGYIVLRRPFDPTRVYNLLQMKLRAQRRVSEAAGKLFDALHDKKTLEQMVDVAYDLLGNPIHISDIGHILLAASSVGADNVPDWMETEYTRFPLSDEHVERMNQNNRDIYLSDRPIIIPREVYQRRLIGAKICVQERLVAYIYVIESNKRFEDEDFDIIAIFAEVLSFLFGASNFWRNTKGKGYEYLLTELLSGELTDRAEIKRWFSGIDIKLMPHFKVVTVQKAKNTPCRPEEFDPVGSWMEANITLTRTVIYENRMVAVINSREQKEFEEHIVTHLHRFLKQHKMVMGFSKDTTDICNLQALYTQSVQAIRIGEYIDADQVLYHYQSYAAYDILLTAMSNRATMELAHPAVAKLAAVDSENDGMLCRTLRACVMHFGNLQQAAKELDTNYNTVKYRIKRIGELTGVVLSDEEQMFYLYLSFLMYDMRHSEFVLDKG